MYVCVCVCYVILYVIQQLFLVSILKYLKINFNLQIQKENGKEGDRK